MKRAAAGARLPVLALLLAIVVVVVVVVGCPTASAQAPRSPPTMVDEEPAPPGGDLQKAWFEPTRDGLLFTLEIRELREPQRDHFYLVAFTVNGTRAMAGVGWDAWGGIHTYAGPTSAGRGGEPVEDFANAKLREAHISGGAPAYVTGLIAYGAVDGLEPGAALRDLHAGVTRLDRDERAWRDVDPHSSTLSLVIPKTFPEPRAAMSLPSMPDLSLPDLPTVPSWAFSAAGGILGAAGGAYIAKRGSRPAGAA